MRDSIKRMRPMGIADILDETVDLYRTSFATLMGIAAVLYVPYSVCSNYFMMRYMPRFDPMNPSSSTNPMVFLKFFGATAIGILYVLLVTPFVTGAMTYAVSEKFLSRRATVLASFKRVLNLAIASRMLAAVGIDMAIAVAGMGVIFGAVFVCAAVAAINTTALIAAIPAALLISLGASVGMVYLMIRLALIDCTIVVESKPFFETFSRTWAMMKGSMLKCFGLLAISGLVTGMVGGIVMQPTSMIITASTMKGGHPSQLILLLHTLIGCVSQTMLAPIASIVSILLYYDIRIRKEGYDLELLASEMDAKSKQRAAWSSQPLPEEQVVVPPVSEQRPPEETPGTQ